MAIRYAEKNRRTMCITLGVSVYEKLERMCEEEFMYRTEVIELALTKFFDEGGYRNEQLDFRKRKDRVNKSIIQV